MDKISEILANAIDLCGGSLVEKLPENSALLHVLNVIADMELALQNSSKGIRGLNVGFTLSTRKGYLGDDLISKPEFVRYRPDTSNVLSFGKWRVLEVVSDIDDLTRAENTGREAIMFTGAHAPFAFELSFTPVASIACEIWGARRAAQASGLTQAVSLPREFSELAAAKAAFILLDELLLIDDKYKSFVFSRKATLETKRLKALEHWWLNYRSNANDSFVQQDSRAYDPFQEGEFGSVFEN